MSRIISSVVVVFMIAFVMLPSMAFANGYKQSLYEIRMHVENYALQLKADPSQSKAVKVSGKYAVKQIIKFRPSAFATPEGNRIQEWLVKDDNASAVQIRVEGIKELIILIPYAKGSPIDPQGLIITLEHSDDACEYKGHLGFVSNGCVCAVLCNKEKSCGVCPADEASFYGKLPNDNLPFDKFDIDDELPLYDIKEIDIPQVNLAADSCEGCRRSN